MQGAEVELSGHRPVADQRIRPDQQVMRIEPGQGSQADEEGQQAAIAEPGHVAGARPERGRESRDGSGSSWQAS